MGVDVDGGGVEPEGSVVGAWLLRMERDGGWMAVGCWMVGEWMGFEI